MKKGTLIGSILGGLFGTAAVIGGSVLLEKKQRAKMAEEAEEDVSDAVDYVVVEDTDSDAPADEAATAEE